RADDILNLLRTEILEGEAHLVEHLIAHHATDADSSRLGQRLQPRGDGDSVAKDVVAINNDVANVDADTKVDPLFGGHTGIAFGHAPLNIDGASYRINYTGKLQQQAIASSLYDSAAVFGNFL